jgi:protein disulfide-isomerase A6
VVFISIAIYSGIKLAAVDATEAGELADQFGVKGYPTIKFFPKGSLTPEDYDGGRTADTIVKYATTSLNEKGSLLHRS